MASTWHPWNERRSAGGVGAHVARQRGMRFKKKIIEREVTAYTRTICDSCGRDLDQRDPADSSYMNNSVELNAAIGDIFPEGDQRTLYEVDICGSCFIAKVV